MPPTQEAPTIPVEDLSYRITTPEQRSRAEWRGIYAFAHSTMLADLTDPAIPEEHRRTPEELAQWQLPHRFFPTHMDPNLMVGEEMRANQEYRNPHVVTAQHGEQIVGYLYTAENVSGGALARAVKRHIRARTFIWAWEAAVDPEVRQQGVGTTLLLADLVTRDRGNQVSTYIWPDLSPGLVEGLKKRGFTSTGESEVSPFPEPPTVRQERLGAGVGALRRTLPPSREERRQVIRKGLVTIDNQLDI